jgi:hypothetical protein
MLCAQCGLHWDKECESPKCETDGHDHQVFEVHRHLDTVTFPDGVTVIGASFDPGSYFRGQPPDYGLYLDPQWQPPWEHSYLDWPDFGAPDDAGPLFDALRAVRDRARAGRRVEIGCLGGHGRTGTALACLAVLSGVPAQEAVAWVRTNYCSNAVETPEQAAFVASLTRSG